MHFAAFFSAAFSLRFFSIYVDDADMGTSVSKCKISVILKEVLSGLHAEAIPRHRLQPSQTPVWGSDRSGWLSNCRGRGRPTAWPCHTWPQTAHAGSGHWITFQCPPGLTEGPRHAAGFPFRQSIHSTAYRWSSAVPQDLPGSGTRRCPRPDTPPDP